MISIPGQLSIRSLTGKFGPFNTGKLTTSIGEFVVKDKILDQYEEGKYDGTFVIMEIKPYTYLYQNRAVYEIQARLNDMMLNDNTILVDDEESLTAMSEHDPATYEQLSTQVIKTKQIDRTVMPSLSEEDDATLFGVCWPLGDKVRLDSTEDRLKLREQSSRLKALNYQFDYKTQIWTKQSSSYL